MIVRRLPAAALLALLACDPAAAQAYKWIDANGRTHFSDAPPPDRQADRLTIRPQAPEDPQAAARRPDWQAQLQESNVRGAQQRVQQEAAERERRTLAYECAVARDDVNALQRGRVFRYDAYGEKQYLEDADRPAALAAAQESVSRYCR